METWFLSVVGTPCKLTGAASCSRDRSDYLICGANGKWKINLPCIDPTICKLKGKSVGCY